LLEKKFVLIPIMSETGQWNIAVIENLKRLISLFILKQYEIANKSLVFGKPKFFYFLFDKLQEEEDDPWDEIIKLLHNFMLIYMRIKYNVKSEFHKVLFKQNVLGVTSFNLIPKKISSIEINSECGAVVARILRESLRMKGDLINFIEKNVNLKK
jgi:hypothetical protein